MKRVRPSETNRAARARSWLGNLDPLATVRPWLDKVTALRPRFGRLVPLTAWSSLTGLTPLIFARYLFAFFAGIIVAVAWQSSRSGTKAEADAVTPSALYSMQRSVDNLAAEVTKIRATEQDILGKISARPPQPVAAVRNPPPRPSSAR
jgi:hypothetical protein